MSNFPSWTFSTIRGSNFVSAGIMTDLQVQVSIAQAHFRQAAGSFSSLASFVKVGQASNGYAGGELAHSQIINVQKDQHHTEIHGSMHSRPASDGITYASANRAGIMSVGARNKTKMMDVSATFNRSKMSSYVGNASVSQLISLGFQPGFVQIFLTGSGHAYEWMYGAPYTARQTVTGAATVDFRNFHGWVTNAFASHADGFMARTTCNINTQKYYFRAF